MTMTATEKEDVLAAKELTELQMAHAVQLSHSQLLTRPGHHPEPAVLAALIQAMAMNYATIAK